MTDETITTACLPTFGHGGHRVGAGRKRGGAVKPKALDTANPSVIYAQAKAKLETCKAQMAELDYRQRRGELLEAKDVELLATRLHAFLAQSLRGLPDNLERQLGLSPDQVQMVQDYTDSLCLEIRERLHGF